MNTSTAIKPAMPHARSEVSRTAAPVVTAMRVVPVAGRDSLLLNLSGAHGPYFTRNLVILSDSAGHTGVGEVPGGEKIRQTLEDAREIVIGRSIAAYNAVLNALRHGFADRIRAGAACRRSISVSRYTR